MSLLPFLNSYRHNILFMAFYKQTSLLSPQNIIVIIGVVLVSVIDERSDTLLVIYVLVSFWRKPSLSLECSDPIISHSVRGRDQLACCLSSGEDISFSTELLLPCPAFGSLDFVVVTQKLLKSFSLFNMISLFSILPCFVSNMSSFFKPNLTNSWLSSQQGHTLSISLMRFIFESHASEPQSVFLGTLYYCDTQECPLLPFEGLFCLSHPCPSNEIHQALTWFSVLSLPEHPVASLSLCLLTAALQLCG